MLSQLVAVWCLNSHQQLAITKYVCRALSAVRTRTRYAVINQVLPVAGETDEIIIVATNTSHRYLRSATHGDLQVPRTRMVTYGPRSFAVFGLTIWNTLRSTLRLSTITLGQFQSGLKTMLFRLAHGT